MKQTVLLTLGVVLGLLAVMAVVGDPARWPAPEVPPHQGEAAAPRFLDGHAIHDPAALARLIREPQNTWSNLGFILAGAWLATTGRVRLARAVGVAVIAVGVGSFLYHASASRTLRHADVAAMYWLSLMIWLFAGATVSPACGAWFEKRAWTAAALTLIAAAGIAAVRNVVVFGLKPLAVRWFVAVTVAVLVSVLVMQVVRERTRDVLWRAVAIVVLLTAAIAFQTGDRPGRWLFRPEATVQAHALWHVLAATALVMAVRQLARGRPRV